MHEDEDELWTIYLGYPLHEEIAGRKANGWYATQAEVTWKTKAAQKAEAQSARLTEVTIDAITAWNASKLVKAQGGVLAGVSLKVGLETRRKQIKRCLKVASDICLEHYGDRRIVPEFWHEYFACCHLDDYRSGRKKYEGSDWAPSMEYLTRPDKMVEIYTRASE
jgi:hypothetical protein